MFYVYELDIDTSKPQVQVARWTRVLMAESIIYFQSAPAKYSKWREIIFAAGARTTLQHWYFTLVFLTFSFFFPLLILFALPMTFIGSFFFKWHSTVVCTDFIDFWQNIKEWIFGSCNKKGARRAHVSSNKSKPRFLPSCSDMRAHLDQEGLTLWD